MTTLDLSITVPTWLLWLLVVALAVSTANSLVGSYLAWLKIRAKEVQHDG